jgi:hypothetical protein
LGETVCKQSQFSIFSEDLGLKQCSQKAAFSETWFHKISGRSTLHEARNPPDALLDQRIDTTRSQSGRSDTVTVSVTFHTRICHRRQRAVMKFLILLLPRAAAI